MIDWLVGDETGRSVRSRTASGGYMGATGASPGMQKTPVQMLAVFVVMEMGPLAAATTATSLPGHGRAPVTKKYSTLEATPGTYHRHFPLPHSTNSTAAQALCSSQCFDFRLGRGYLMAQPRPPDLIPTHTQGQRLGNAPADSVPALSSSGIKKRTRRKRKYHLSTPLKLSHPLIDRASRCRETFVLLPGLWRNQTSQRLVPRGLSIWGCRKGRK
ncbi:hypothetical protein DFH27DRAFT_78174 [Peziza echinospora]|nr:hypothetical protein DFH27DRAFT_78174 [Peziza echinospora]